MYIPPAFREDDPAVLHRAMREYPFATLVTADGGMPFATHLPVMAVPEAGGLGVIRGHVARTNPQGEVLQRECPCLVIFHGPHAYVSPRWYATPRAVPTWHYVAVHAYGHTRCMSDAELLTFLTELSAVFEGDASDAWRPPEGDWIPSLLPAIIGFEIEIERLEGKVKAGQNRPPADQRGVREAMSGSSDPMARALVGWMPPGCEPVDTRGPA